MIGWTRRVLGAAWVISASLACAVATPAPSTPKLLRSPSLDYGDGVRSASDGEVMGAEGRPAQDWLAGSMTNEHAGPGWSLHGGRPHFTLEHDSRAAGEAPACLPRRGPPTPDEVQGHVALTGAWLPTAPEPSRTAFAVMVADAPEAPSHFLTCDSR